jgi:hypothetical protein
LAVISERARNGTPLARGQPNIENPKSKIRKANRKGERKIKNQNVCLRKMG